MIHGWINADGKLILGADTPTEEYALRCWMASYSECQITSRAVLEIVTHKVAEPETPHQDTAKR